MGGCGSCGPSKGIAWTRERLDEVAAEAQAELREGRSPARVFARRFADGVDACGMDDESARRVAELWLAWGVLEAIEGLVSAGPARTERIGRAVSLLGDALQCGPTPRVNAAIRYNLGATLLASTLRPDRADTGPSEGAGSADLASMPWTVAGDAADLDAWARAAAHLAAVVDGDDGDDALRAGARRALGLTYCLRGITGRPLRVRARLAALDDALASLDTSDPLRDVAESARQRLGALSSMTRLLGHHEEALPEAARLLPLRAGGLFHLPPGVLDVSPDDTDQPWSQGARDHAA